LTVDLQHAPAPLPFAAASFIGEIPSKQNESESNNRL
jgi:hypothetical protein